MAEEIKSMRLLSETSICAKVKLIIKLLWYLDFFSLGDLLLFFILAAHLNEQASDDSAFLLVHFLQKR